MGAAGGDELRADSSDVGEGVADDVSVGGREMACESVELSMSSSTRWMRSDADVNSVAQLAAGLCSTSTSESLVIVSESAADPTLSAVVGTDSVVAPEMIDASMSASSENCDCCSDCCIGTCSGTFNCCC
jgi:hypothetical protein